ncbi:hypothetical protein WJX82_003721 [Trebouxia sp. C0006]
MLHPDASKDTWSHRAKDANSARHEKVLIDYKITASSLLAYERDNSRVLGKKNAELEGRLATSAGTIREVENNQAALKSQLAIKDQACKDAQASLHSSISSLETVTHDLNERHTLEMDALRQNHGVRAAELSEQVTQLQGQLQEERRARKQQGEHAELAHKALHDRQAKLEMAYQRITAAEAASHEGQSKAQALQAVLASARQEAVNLKGQLDAATKNNSMLKQQLNAAAHKAEAESAVAAKHAQHQQEQQQHIKLHAEMEESKKHSAAAHHAELLAKETASGEQISTLQKELEQLHASAAHMKPHLEAAQQSQTDAQERERRLAAELSQAEAALTNGEADRQALISHHAAALEQQGQRVEALEKQLQKLQEVEEASRQEVEQLSQQLYLKRPQVDEEVSAEELHRNTDREYEYPARHRGDLIPAHPRVQQQHRHEEPSHAAAQRTHQQSQHGQGGKRRK